MENRVKTIPELHAEGECRIEPEVSEEMKRSETMPSCRVTGNNE